MSEVKFITVEMRAMIDGITGTNNSTGPDTGGLSGAFSNYTEILLEFLIQNAENERRAKEAISLMITDGVNENGDTDPR